MYEKYNRNLAPATKAWVVMALGITAYELACPKGETLSEGVDRLMERSPVSRAATLGALAITSAHLGNLIPQKYDPFHYALFWKHRPESPLANLPHNIA